MGISGPEGAEVRILGTVAGLPVHANHLTQAAGTDLERHVNLYPVVNTGQTTT